MLTLMGKRTPLLSLVGLLATALWGAACAAPAPDALLGVETIEDVLPFFDGSSMREPTGVDQFPPMRVLLSRSRYWAQDGHLDVVIQLNEDAPQGELRVRVLGEGGRVLSRFEISPLPGPRFIFYPAIPQALLRGGAATLETVWARGGEAVAEDSQSFRVKVHEEPAPRSGRVRLTVPNEAGAVQRGVPARLGVPFPRGVLADAAHLRLVDESGAEVHVQAEETARWSKFGSVRWVLVGFAVDLDGGPRELFLEYGPDVRRAERAAIGIQPRSGFPAVDAGTLRFDGGLWYDAAGDGNFVKVLEERALRGAFVEHEDGRIYRVPADAEWTVEESGPEKVILKGEGWYREEGGEREFCKYLIRWVIHRGSPLARVFHTWIFTGDGNRDRIANMGWEFPLPENFEREGFLTAFGGGEWADADYLLQWDYDRYALASGGETLDVPGGRAAGAAAAHGNGARLLFGAKDFWQNYPSELEFAGGSLWFHNWPRHNKPAAYTFDGELVMARGEPALPSAERHGHYQEGRLTRSEWKLNLLQARFAHEGEVLDFRLPDRVAENPIWRRSSRDRGGSTYWEKGDPESANAQGISRTEEMWLVLSPDAAPQGQAAPVLSGLNDEALRAVADPAWVAASGALYEMHPQDKANYPEEERIYELIALSPDRIREHLGMYGMWIYGDLPLWNPAMETREPDLYRAFRKRHHGWPYPWKPFARSGDSRLFKIAEASTRQMMDANWCHYVGEDVSRRVEQVGTRFHRREGILHRSTLPWATRRGATTRCYESQSDYLWRAWHLAGCRRARDIVLRWAELTKEEEPLGGRGSVRSVPNRASITLLKSYLETWGETFAPWYLVAVHALAEGHIHQYRTTTWRGRLWETGDREYMRFTGDEGDFKEYYMAYVDAATSETVPNTINRRKPHFPPKAFAWHLTGDEYYLRRIVNGIQFGTFTVRDGAEPEELQGYIRRTSTGYTLFTPYYLRWFPVGLWALEKAGRVPDAIPNLFAIYPHSIEHEKYGHRLDFALRKEAGRPLPMTLGAYVLGRRPAGEHERADYVVTGPDGREALAGTWQIRERKRIEVPAEAPAGTYRLQVLYERGVRRLEFDVPVSDLDIPEVIVAERGGPMARVFSGQYRESSQGLYWFHVPEGVERFGVDFPGYFGASVWGPGGERLWNQADYYGDEAGYSRAELEVGPGQAGRLWRITLASGNFVMDEQIPPYFSVNRTRWFEADGE